MHQIYSDLSTQRPNYNGGIGFSRTMTQIHASGGRYTTAKGMPLLPGDDDPRLAAARSQGDGSSAR
jgi:hypothetical protein